MNQMIDFEFALAGKGQPRQRPRDFFGRMLAISLALHVISSVVLLAPRQGTLTIPKVSYLDLKNISLGNHDLTVPAKHLPVETLADQTGEDPLSPPPSYPETEKFDHDIRKSTDAAQIDPKTLGERSFSLGLKRGYFSSIGSGDTLRDSIREYYFRMLQEINEKWWVNSGSLTGGWRGAIIEVVVARNGTIIDKILVRSSGNRSFDRAIVSTLEQANPLPPLPDDYQPGTFRAPLRFLAPLNLLGS